MAWGSPDTTPKYLSCKPCTNSGVGANQHNLQHPTSTNITTPLGQAFSQNSTTSNSRNQRGIIYRQMNLPPSLQQVMTTHD